MLSTAVFHWVPDHDALFRNLAAVTAPGGWLVAQCGGAGNIARVMAVLGRTGDGWLGDKYFATPLDTTRRLDAAGYVDIECWLTDEPTWFDPGEPFETFLRTVILGAHLERSAARTSVTVRPRGRRGARRADDRLRPAEHQRTTSRAAEPSRGAGAPAPQRVTRNGSPWPGITTSATASTRARLPRAPPGHRPLGRSPAAVGAPPECVIA